jgi:hypothetical protein
LIQKNSSIGLIAVKKPLNKAKTIHRILDRQMMDGHTKSPQEKKAYKNKTLSTYLEKSKIVKMP